MLNLAVNESKSLRLYAIRGEALVPIPPGGEVTLVSSDPKVATVTQSPAIVTAVGPGSASISLKWKTPTGDEFSDSLQVTVEGATGVRLMVE